AYQGYGLGMDKTLIRSIGYFATGGIKPDLTIFLDLPVEKGLNARSRAKDRIEQRSIEYHKRVRNGYLMLAKIEPKRIKIVKVATEKNITQKDIRSIIKRYAI
ncbi:dTMP kinase, partial [bacterium]